VAVCIRAGVSGITLVALGLSLSACGGSQDAAASDVAARFFEAVAQDDGTAACAQLTPATRGELEQSSGKDCATAILEEVSDVRGDGGDVEVYGTMAQVRWGDGAVFLTRMPDGWRILATGCAPRADAPYDCAVKGA
jgi:hypothetical protein